MGLTSWGRKLNSVVYQRMHDIQAADYARMVKKPRRPRKKLGPPPVQEPVRKIPPDCRHRKPKAPLDDFGPG